MRKNSFFKLFALSTSIAVFLFVGSCTKLFDMVFTPQYTLKVEKMGQGTITAVADGKLPITEAQLLSGIKLDTGTNIVITASISRKSPPRTAPL